jgi:phosphohistidine swiveling domain-containing protein
MSYFKDHWTLSEWLAHSARRDALIAEDASKRSRLAILRALAGVPSVTTNRFPYRELLDGSAGISEFAESCGDTPYAIRLNPLSTGEVLRERGRPVHELISWAREKQLPADAYGCVFERHVESRSSAIFVCAKNGVWGEFHDGPLLGLNRGSLSESITRFNSPWRGSAELPNLVERALRCLEISDEHQREALRDECGATFAGNHLLGYFEVIRDASDDLWFVDYNRLLIADAPQSLEEESAKPAVVLQGQTGSRGKGQGVVLHAPDKGVTSVPENTVLVARSTRPELIEMMTSSHAVVTELGGVLSHAAIACRELGIPCVVGVKGALTALAEGVEVIVDADAGRIDVA